MHSNSVVDGQQSHTRLETMELGKTLVQLARWWAGQALVFCPLDDTVRYSRYLARSNTESAIDARIGNRV